MIYVRYFNEKKTIYYLVYYGNFVFLERKINIYQLKKKNLLYHLLFKIC